MIVILGLVILVAALVAGVAGVLTNGGHSHAAGHFAVFGYHVTGSTGILFLYGIVVGAVALPGLSLLLTGARRTSRRAREARRGLRQSRRETAAVTRDRDDLIEQRDTASGHTASTLGDDGTARNGSDPGLRGQACSSACSRAGPLTRRPPRARRCWPAKAPAPAPVPAAQPEPPACEAPGSPPTRLSLERRAPPS